MKTVKLLAVLALSFCAFSASATGSSTQISPLQHASFNLDQNAGGIELVRYGYRQVHRVKHRHHRRMARRHWR